MEAATVKNESRFLSAADVSELLGVSSTTAYRIIKQLNDELKQQGKIVLSGKIAARYFYEKVAI